MITIGVAGGMGSGKSYVCNILKNVCDVPVYNCDNRVKLLMNGSESLRQKLISEFGPECYEGGEWNRPYAVKIAAKDATVLDRMGDIIEPYLVLDIQDFKKSTKKEIIAIESALFNKSKSLLAEVDYIFMVVAPLEQRIVRIKKRDPMRTDREIIMLLHNQFVAEDSGWMAKFKHSISNGDDEPIDVTTQVQVMINSVKNEKSSR